MGNNADAVHSNSSCSHPMKRSILTAGPNLITPPSSFQSCAMCCLRWTRSNHWSAFSTTRIPPLRRAVQWFFSTLYPESGASDSDSTFDHQYQRAADSRHSAVSQFRESEREDSTAVLHGYARQCICVEDPIGRKTSKSGGHTGVCACPHVPRVTYVE